MTDAPLPPSRVRYPTLDLLRVVAITMTVLIHTPRLLSRIPGGMAVQGGLWLGVDLFMLISGWLLGGQLFREAARGKLEPLRFYVKRWMRTLPPYYVMLIVLQLTGPRWGWVTLLEHATFLQVYLHKSLYLVSWSLCVEEQFYLALPLLVALLLRRPRLGTLVGLVAGAEAIAVACRVITYSAPSDTPWLTHMRSDGLFIGMAFAWIDIHRPALWASLGRVAAWLAPVGAMATVLVMLSFRADTNRWMYIGGPTIGTWTLALAFLACVHEASPFSRISFPGLRYLGELTYGIYLTHDNWPRSIVDAAGGAGTVRGALWRLGLMLASAVVLHHLVERPALWLRERLLARWRVAVPDAPPVPGGSGDYPSARPT